MGVRGGTQPTVPVAEVLYETTQRGKAYRIRFLGMAHAENTNKEAIAWDKCTSQGTIRITAMFTDSTREGFNVDTMDSAKSWPGEQVTNAKSPYS